MSIYDFFQIFMLLALTCIITPFLGRYIYHIFETKTDIGRIEGFIYKTCAIDPKEQMRWTAYAKNMLIFNLIGFIVLFCILCFQYYLPLNPQNLPNVPWDLAFNTTASFVTNTNWQAYAGETTLSYFSQMLGLAVQNFLSAATGLVVLIALIRGMVRKSSDVIGNYWQDMVRAILYLLLPISIAFAIILSSQGVIQNFDPYLKIKTLENQEQTIPMGPVASQIAIKQLGTNGGGYFNANSAHPFENPNPLTNFLETLAIIVIPAAVTYTFGLMVGQTRQGWMLLIVILALLIIGLVVAVFAEIAANPLLGPGSDWEGKETRIGITRSVVWGIFTTATSNGSVNSMLSSYTPLAGGVCLFFIMIEEVVFGGVGVGLAGLLMFVFLTVFLSGLMVGRTPEYLGKKIEKKEILWVMVALLTPSALILTGSALAAVLPDTVADLSIQGPHGLSELLYAFASAAGNNGSSFAGLNANTTFFNLVLGIVMILGRLSILIPSLAIGGYLVKKKVTPATIGTFSTDSFIFGILIMGVVIIVGSLTFFPALSLGPVLEHFLMMRQQSF